MVQVMSFVMNVMEKGEKSVLCAGVKERKNVVFALVKVGNDAHDAEELELIHGEIDVLGVTEQGMKNVSVAMVLVITDVRSALAQEEKHVIIVMEPE